MMLQICQSLTFACVILCVGASPFAQSPRRQPQRCGTSDPDETLHAHHSHLQHYEPLDNSLWNSSLVRAHTASIPPVTSRDLALPDQSDPSAIVNRQASQPLLTIDTYFHIVSDIENSTPAGKLFVTAKMITDQSDYLSNAYASTGIAFHFRGITFTVNDTWARNGDDRAMKTALRQGTYTTLNIYYQTLLQTEGTEGSTGEVILGSCALPFAGILSRTPNMTRENYVTDGCNILSATMPGGSMSGYNLGATTVHEVGHWNGLLHPFTGQTCAEYDSGDYVADTPQEKTATDGCPSFKDTCPNSGVPEGSYDGVGGSDPYGPSGYAGPDPIHNYMDYSSDECMIGFTSGQAARMLNLWTLYREGR